MKLPAKERLVTTLEEWKGLHVPGRPPRILLDHEQRAFVDEALTHMTFKEIEAACRERFGPTRGLSDDSINRYWQAKRKKRANR